MSIAKTELPPKCVKPINVIEYPIIEGCEHGTYGLLIIENYNRRKN